MWINFLRLIFFVWLNSFGFSLKFPPRYEPLCSFQPQSATYNLDFINRKDFMVSPVVVNGFNPIQRESIRICSLFALNSSRISDVEYCLGNTQSSLRAIRTVVISTLYKNHVIDVISKQDRMSNEMKMTTDSLLYSYTYAYDAGLSLQTHTQSVCFFGEISAKALLMALAVAPIVDLLMITIDLTVDDTIQLDIVFKEIACNTNHQLQILTLDEFFVRQSSVLFGRLCDIIHVMGGTHDDLTNIIRAAEPCSDAVDEKCDLYRKAIDQHLIPPVHIIKEYYYSYESNMQEMYSRILSIPNVDWNGFVSWGLNSGLSSPESSEGLQSKKLNMYVNFEYNAADTWLGVVSYDANKRTPGTTTDNGTVADHAAGILLQQELIIVISYNGRIFAENAKGFQQICQRIGYKHTYIRADVTLEDIEILRNDFMREFGRQPMFVQLLFGAIEPSMLLPHYIIYETEQIDTLQHLRSISHRSLLIRAVCVFAFSDHHRLALKALGCSCVHVVPLYTSIDPNAYRAGADYKKLIAPSPVNKLIEPLELLQVLIEHANSEDSFENEFLYDIVFFGGMSERRRENLKLVFQNISNSPNLKIGLFQGNVDSYIREEERDSIVSKSKVIINFHGCNGSSLAVHRMNYLLGMGKCIVSERSTADLNLDALYEDSIVFVDSLIEIGAIAEKFASNPIARQEMERRARAQFDKIHKNWEPLQQLLEIVGSKLLTKDP